MTFRNTDAESKTVRISVRLKEIISIRQDEDIVPDMVAFTGLDDPVIMDLPIILSLAEGSEEAWTYGDLIKAGRVWGYRPYGYYEDEELTRQIPDPENYDGIAWTLLTVPGNRDESEAALPGWTFRVKLHLTRFDSGSYETLEADRVRHTFRNTARKKKTVSYIFVPEETGCYQFITRAADTTVVNGGYSTWRWYDPGLRLGVLHAKLWEGETCIITVTAREGPGGNYSTLSSIYCCREPRIDALQINFPENSILTENNWESKVTKTVTYTIPDSGVQNSYTSLFKEGAHFEGDYCIDLRSIGPEEYGTQKLGLKPYADNEGRREYDQGYSPVLAEADLVFPPAPEKTETLSEGTQVCVPGEYKLKIGQNELGNMFTCYLIQTGDPDAQIHYQYSCGNTDFGYERFYVMDYPGSTGKVTIYSGDPDAFYHVTVTRLPAILSIQAEDVTEVTMMDGLEDGPLEGSTLTLTLADGTQKYVKRS